MRVLDLCAGIGGFSYAAHRLGWTTEAFCERDAFCQKVLAKNFPGVPMYDDVYTFPSEPFRGRIDVLTGGFPCQPFSQAGKRLGVDDERHLFPELLRIVREILPTWCIFENVGGLTSMALEIRDSKVGRTKYSRTEEIDDYEAIYTRTETMLLNRICEEIEREGYAVQPVIVPAVSLEADHERKRIWIVARRNDSQPDSERNGRITVHGQGEGETRKGTGLKLRPECGDQARHGNPNAPDTHNRERSGIRLGSEPEHSGIGRDDCDAPDAESCESGAGVREARSVENGSGNGSRDADNSAGIRHGQENEVSAGRNGSIGSSGRNALDTLPDPTQGQRVERDGPGPSRLRHREDARRPANWYEAAVEFCGMAHGTSDKLDEFGMPNGRDNRVERLKALGNAIYWKCAYEIFYAIQESENAANERN